MLDRNGNSETVHLVARVDELALALDHVPRELAETWGPRLVDRDRDLAGAGESLGRERSTRPARSHREGAAP